MDKPNNTKLKAPNDTDEFVSKGVYNNRKPKGDSETTGTGNDSEEPKPSSA